jgi:acyl-coenzyme A synthetase/AMP-(fatty) acid ligase
MKTIMEQMKGSQESAFVAGTDVVTWKSFLCLVEEKLTQMTNHETHIVSSDYCEILVNIFAAILLNVEISIADPDIEHLIDFSSNKPMLDNGFLVSVHTSGSTGIPKKVGYSLRNFAWTKVS